MSIGRILGLDLSARAAAGVVVPTTWDGAWQRVQTIVVGEALPKNASDQARALRCGYIATRLLAFAQKHQVTEVWIEGYAFSQHTAAHTIAEVGGCVRLALVEAGIEIHTANMATARKLLLGKLPARGSGVSAKEKVVEALRMAGAAFQTVDEFDAFTAANYGMSQGGGFFFGQVAA